MRLPRTSLLARITDVDAPGFVLIEAPTGFGKSWLLRKAAPPGALRLRGEFGPLLDASFDPQTVVIIDDAHLLRANDVERLVQYVEDAPPSSHLIVSGRILSDAIHDVAHLVDGLILDASAIALGAEEIIDELPEVSETLATQLVDATQGWIKMIAVALDQLRLDPTTDPVANALRAIRAAAGAVLQQLDANDIGIIGLVARAPGIDQPLLFKLGGPGFLDRVLAAGVPLRRQVTGAIDLVGDVAFRSADVDPTVAARLATALMERDRPMEAIGLLLDAGAHDRAARMLMEIPESIARTVEPRAMLALLARLGTMTEREPALLLIRATASSVIGRIDSAGADIDKAMAQAARSSDAALGRRVSVEAAEWMLLQGRTEAATEAAAGALGSLGPGEDRTYARAHMVLADAASMSNRRADLQRAAEWYRVAAAAWDGCGEFAKGRLSRSLLAYGVLVPLGRFDEALALLGQVLSVADLSDAERAWTLLNEGFVLCSTNRLDSAENRFNRVADLGYVQDNPRLIAAAAWGRALVATRRDDLDTTIRWVATAENTALGPDDDVLGVMFHCDAATAFGALGQLDLAERHLAQAKERKELYKDEVQLTSFILAARNGEFGDVATQLETTPPAEWWRVELVSAMAAARAGDHDSARTLLADAERELIGLGFSDFAALGERRTHHDVLAILNRAPAVDTQIVANGDERPIATDWPAAPRVMTGRRLRVVGGPMAVEDADGVVGLPPGNPQRLVGVVVANGGLATFDQLSEAIWPGDDVEASRARLRNVLLRLRRGVGDVVIRAGSGVRLAPGVECDLYEFERLATDALAAVRSDPDFAGQLAMQAVGFAEGSVFGDFEYEEWAIASRRSVEHKLIGLLDLLSVQAEDAGQIALAQSLAERALRLDRYTDSRYVRLAELLALQGRSAAAVAVLEDAAEAAREIGGNATSTIKSRRDEIMRRASNG